MARKTVEVRIPNAEGNRDSGKLFLITEMSAADTERWASDALHGLTQSGVELPEDVKNTGTMGLATLGVKALGGMPSATFHDLMDRMMTTVTYYPDPSRREVNRPPSEMMSDIEEVSTLIRLRAECFSLHTGFTWAAAKSLGGQTETAPN